MNRLLSLLVLPSALLLGGCATPLNVAKDSGRFAEILGISPADVLLLSYCSFGKSLKGPKPRFKRNEGVIVVTPTQLHLLQERVYTNTEPKTISLNYSDMNTVAHILRGYGCQVHVENKDYIIIIEIGPNKVRWDCDLSKTFFDLVMSKGVREVESKKWYYLEGGGGLSPIYIGPLF